VFNMTGNYLTNNPPPVPYLNINEFKRLWYSYQNEILDQNKATYIPPKTGKLYVDPSRSMEDQLKKFIYSVFEKSHPLQFTEEIQKINNKLGQHPLITKEIKKLLQISRNTNTNKQNIDKAIQIINNNNALSSIGTLEFMDQIAKFNTIDIVYSEESNNTSSNMKRITDPTNKHNKKYTELMFNDLFT